ncbi:MAG TPA: I78 family peptidase inhibitor [Pseudomonas sp.]|nr:I78 family peptidase inhibitor [Pseudomonas sp.]
MSPRLLLSAALLTLLAGCATPSPTERAGRQACESARLGHLVGRDADPGTVERARTQAGAERVRVVEPGMAVTLEYDAQRLTLYTDDQGRIKLISCG